MGRLEDTIAYVFQLCGGIGMFFSFTEVRFGPGATTQYLIPSNRTPYMH